jgi:hypothetical protein
MSQVLGALGLMDFTMLRSFLAWRAFWKLWTVYFFNFPIFFEPHWNADTKSESTAALLYFKKTWILLQKYVTHIDSKINVKWNNIFQYHIERISECYSYVHVYQFMVYKLVQHCAAKLRRVSAAVTSIIRKCNTVKFIRNISKNEKS